MSIPVKICGISEPETLQAAVRAGARFIGLVFYSPSPRHVSFNTALNLTRAIPTGIRSVGLFVDPANEELEHIVSRIQLDMIQLHGNEKPARVAEVKEKFKIPVMKAIRVGGTEDLKNLESYEDVADWLLFDAKAEKQNKGASEVLLPGGTGHSFEWTILKGRRFKKPWMLGGGLTAENVGRALSILKPDVVDVSSGVEARRGVKDPDKISTFIETVKKFEKK